MLHDFDFFCFLNKKDARRYEGIHATFQVKHASNQKRIATYFLQIGSLNDFFGIDLTLYNYQTTRKA